MTTPRASILIALAVAALAAPASAQPGKRGGLLDGLGGGPAGGPAGGPSHTDCPGPTNPGGRPPPLVNPPPVLTPPPAPPGAGADGLNAEIEAMRRRLAELEGKRPGDLPTSIDPAKAREIIDRYKAAAAKLAAEVPAEDRARMDRLRERQAAFHEQFDKHRQAIETGVCPEGMKPADWAKLCDDYYLQRAQLEASLKGAERAMRQRSGRAGEAQRQVDAAEAALREALASGQRLGPELIARLHQARIALLRQRLRELEAIRTEREGKESRRNNASTSAAFYREGDWYIDTMNWLAREISLVGRAGPPADPAADGLAIPDWLTNAAKMSALQRQRAKVKWISRQMEVLSQAMADAMTQTRDADEEQLRQRRAELEAADRADDPSLSDGAKKLARQRALDELKAEQERTRPDRVKAQRDRLKAELDEYAKRMEVETAALQRAEREKDDRPAPPPAPGK